MEIWIENLAKRFKTLGDANRLGIVMSIGNGSRSVTEIIDLTGLSQTLVSFHLKVLRDSGIVRTERSGPFIYYSLLEPDLLTILRELAKTVDNETEQKTEVL
ncbi:MAG: winged helix-turn-helix transcriptional regulator [Nitrospirae bacterium]|nr:winged helix-turn-helix transcriptional regulator [Nitrospirota bacterium]